MKTLVPAAPAAEPEFLLAVQRAVRTARDRLAILVHLSRLREQRSAQPPPHQLHVARSILQEAAQRFEGQVFNFRNGDLALLCRTQMSRDDVRAGGAPVVKAFEPTALPGILARLFHADMARLISVWPLATEGDALLGYAADRLAETPLEAIAKPARPAVPLTGLTTPRPKSPSRPTAVAEPGAIAVIDGISALLAGSRVAELMRRQTAIRLRVDDLAGRRFDNAVFRELTFSVTSLEARISTLDNGSGSNGSGGQGMARADPFLFRHLAGRLDARMLGLLLAEAGTGHLLDLLAAGPDDAAWHLNLTLPAILSDAFNRLLDLRRQVGLGIEIAYMEAAGDPAAFGRAREVLHQAGVSLVLDGVDDTALRLTRPWRLGADLVKLDWSPRLAAEAEGNFADEAIVNGIERIGPNAVVLQRAESPEALAWGMARGIEIFQGRQVDALLADRRMAGCELAGGCTLRQCLDRAAATAGAGRVGCGNTGLLDTARQVSHAATHAAKRAAKLATG